MISTRLHSFYYYLKENEFNLDETFQIIITSLNQQIAMIKSLYKNIPFM